MQHSCASMLGLLIANAFRRIYLDLEHMIGEIIFNKFVSFFEENKLDLEHINMLVTDDAPTVVGRT